MLQKVSFKESLELMFLFREWAVGRYFPFWQQLAQANGNEELMWISNSQVKNCPLQQQIYLRTKTIEGRKRSIINWKVLLQNGKSTSCFFLEPKKSMSFLKSEKSLMLQKCLFLSASVKCCWKNNVCGNQRS